MTNAGTKNSETVLLFDGTCNMCNGAVQWLIRRDKKRVLRYGTLQSPRGEHLRRAYGVDPDVDSMVALVNGSAYVCSDGALAVGRALGGAWAVAARVARLIPRRLRDLGYQFIAKRRYQWFGQQDSCMVPTPELRALFLPES